MVKSTIYTVRHNTPKSIDHNLKADYRILSISGTTISDTTCHQTIIQSLTSPNICFCTTWGNQNTLRWHRNEQQTPKTICDITDSNLEKNKRL